MKKVCIISSEMNPTKGGIQAWMYYFKLFMELNKYKVYTYAYREDKLNFFIKFFIFLNIKCFFLSTWKMLFFVIPFVFFKNKKFFIFVHGNDILDGNKLMDFFLIFVSKFKNIYFIANSKEIAKIFRNKTGRNVNAVIYPFFDTDIEEKGYNINDVNSVVVFGTLSRIVKRKNIQSVLFALKELENDNVNFIYYIAGDGPYRKVLEKIVNNLGLHDNVKFLGKINNMEKDFFYRSIDYFLLPSIFDKESGSIEGYGIVFIESNLYGVPVLSGDTGGMKEAVIENLTGIHSSGEVDDIILKIKKLLKTNFHKENLFLHAKRHDYRKQSKLKFFIKEICND